MRLHIGAFPLDPQFQPERDGWNSFNEPGPVAIQLLAIPIALVVANFLLACFNAAVPPAMNREIMITFTTQLWLPFLAMVLLLPLHEMIHALCYPRLGMTDQTLIGIWPQKVLMYALHLGPMTRARYLVTMSFPFLVLSFVPIAIVIVFNDLPINPTVVTFLFIMSILNGIASSADILGIGLVLARLPGRAIIRTRGWKSYWKLPGQEAEPSSTSSMPTSSSSSP